jgi:alcohol dehydrogenase class IV
MIPGLVRDIVQDPVLVNTPRMPDEAEIRDILVAALSE